MRVLSGHVGGSKSKPETNRFIINEITINPESRTEDDDDAYSCNHGSGLQQQRNSSEEINSKKSSTFKEVRTAPLNVGFKATIEAEKSPR